MVIHAFGISHRGAVREVNQDHFSLGPFVEQNSPLELRCTADADYYQHYGLLACVADGMGGYTGGELASRWCLDALVGQRYCVDEPPAQADVGDVLHRQLKRAQELLAAKLAANPGLASAGTTLAGLLALPDGSARVFHAGDSRVLLFAGGAQGFLRQLTIDHTPIGEALHTGAMGDAEAAQHPLNGQLTRSLGLVGNSEIEVSERMELAAGDLFLICSDGMYGAGRGLPKAQLQELLRQGLPLAELGQACLHAAITQDGADNATLVLVAFNDEAAAAGPGGAA